MTMTVETLVAAGDGGCRLVLGLSLLETYGPKIVERRVIQRSRQADQRSRSRQTALYPEGPIGLLGDRNLVAGVEAEATAQLDRQDQPAPLV